MSRPPALLLLEIFYLRCKKAMLNFKPFLRNQSNLPFIRIRFCKFLEQVIRWWRGSSDEGLDHLDRTGGSGPHPGHQVLGLLRQVLVHLPVGAADVHHQLGLRVELSVTRGAFLLS